MTRSYRRRRIVVDGLQYRLLAINLLYFLVILLILAAFLFTPLVLKLRDGTTLSAVEQQEVASQFLTLHKRIWPALLITFGLLSVHSILVSHRIAGPLYQFRRILKALRDGDLTVRATFRSNDYLRKEEAIFNEMIEAFRAKIKNIDAQSWHLRFVAHGRALWKLTGPWTHTTRPPRLGKHCAFSPGPCPITSTPNEKPGKAFRTHMNFRTGKRASDGPVRQGVSVCEAPDGSAR